MANFNLDRIKFEGGDVDMNVSLFEQGLAWCQIGDSSEYEFIYGVDVDEDCNYTRFCRGVLDLSEWRGYLLDSIGTKKFPNLESVASCSGFTAEEYKENYLDSLSPSMISDLLAYYSHEDIFGSRYLESDYMDQQEAATYAGMTPEEIKIAA